MGQQFNKHIKKKRRVAYLKRKKARIKAALGWKPAHDGIEEIIASAIAWEKRFNR